MSAHSTDELIHHLLQSQDRMLEAIAEFQQRADAIVDCGQRIRSAAERLKSFGGNLDDAGVMRLPRGIMPDHERLRTDAKRMRNAFAPEPPEAA